MTETIFQQVGGLGVTSSLIRQAGDDGLVFKHQQDCAPILEQNKREALAYDPAPERRSGGWRKIASIPYPVMLRLEAAGIVYRGKVLDEKAFFRFLSDPDVRGLRTDNGARLA